MKTLSRSFLDCSGAKHNRRFGPTLATVILVLAPLPSFAGWLGGSRPMMGTEVSVTLWSEDDEAGRAAIEAVFAEAGRIDRLMSTYKEDSEISQINRDAADRPVATGAELFELIRRAIEMSKLTDGAFDITYESVGQHFDFRERRRPDADTVATERDNIDYRYLLLDDDSQTVAFKKRGVRINLGGIAKGYVVERGIQLLQSRQIEHAVVTAGGDSRLLGDRRGRPWMVGIRDPRKDGEVAMTLPLENEAVSTSGDYERFFDEDGTRYHHIIHPATGSPASGVHSASVIGPDAVTTDALSTSVFVMGVDSGLRMIGALPDYEAVVIDADGRVYFSSGLAPPSSSPAH